MSTEPQPAPVLNLAPAPSISAAMSIPPEVAQMIEAQRQENIRLRSAQTEAAIGQAISAAIAEHADQLVPHAASHLAVLLRPGVKLVESGGQSVVAGPQLESVSQFVRDSLGKVEYAPFVKSRGQGGTALNPAFPTPVDPAAQHRPIPPGPLPAPQSYGEAVLRYSQERGIAPQGADPATNVRAGFGGFRSAQPPRD